MWEILHPPTAVILEYNARKLRNSTEHTMPIAKVDHPSFSQSVVLGNQPSTGHMRERLPQSEQFSIVTYGERSLYWLQRTSAIGTPRNRPKMAQLCQGGDHHTHTDDPQRKHGFASHHSVPFCFNKSRKISPRHLEASSPFRDKRVIDPRLLISGPNARCGRYLRPRHLSRT